MGVKKPRAKGILWIYWGSVGFHMFSPARFWWIEGYQQLSIINGLNIGNFSPINMAIKSWVELLSLPSAEGWAAPRQHYQKKRVKLEKMNINGISTHKNNRMFTSVGIHTLNICDII